MANGQRGDGDSYRCRRGGDVRCGAADICYLSQLPLTFQLIEPRQGLFVNFCQFASCKPTILCLRGRFQGADSQQMTSVPKHLQKAKDKPSSSNPSTQSCSQEVHPLDKDSSRFPKRGAKSSNGDIRDDISPRNPAPSPKASRLGNDSSVKVWTHHGIPFPHSQKFTSAFNYVLTLP